jgi:hypothetical protein
LNSEESDMKKNLLPKTASQRAIAGLTSLALVAGGLTVMPYAGAQDETAEPVVATAEPNNDAAAEEAAPTAAAAAPAAAAEDEALPEGAAAVALANAPQGGATLPTGPAKGFVSGTAAGSEVDFQAFELKEGDKVTSVGTEHVNWLRKDQSVNAIANADGQVTIKGVQIPADAKTGDHIYFTYLAKAENYKEYEVMLDATVTSSTETINVDQYTGAKRTLLTTLTQSAFDPASKYIFATRVSFEDGTYTIYKLDAKTLDVVAKNDIEERYAADGIAVDNKGQVWVTNSETGTVSVFKQSDLTHIKTFSQQELPGVKSIVIDNQTDLGYVGGPGGVITVLDINQNKPIGTIALDGFDEVTSLALDQRTNQLIATSGESADPQVAKVDLANGKKVDRYEVKGAREVSGAAYDPVSKNIFVATNESVITVINSETEKVVTTIDTGSGTSDVRYNPKDQRVYAVNTGAGTLSVIDPATNKAVAKLEVGSSPVHVSVASDGTVSVVNNASKDIGAVGQPVDEIYTFKYNAPTPPPQPKPSTSESTTQKPTEKPKPTEDPKPKPPNGSSDLSSKLGKYRTILIAIFSVLGLTGIIAGAVAAMAHANMIPKEWLPPQFR